MNGACAAARTLRGIDKGAWVGPAGAAFRSAIDEVPAKLERGQSAFAAASAALTTYAGVLREAQADAAAAVRRHEAGDAATARWQATRDSATASYDPGEDDRRAAEHQLAEARQRVDTAARRAVRALEDSRHGAPHEPGLLSKAAHAVGSFVRGAGEATWGLAQLAYRTSPVYALVDPEGFVDYEEGLGEGLLFGVEHPTELLKAAVDYDTWRTDPARALGHLVPDLVLAAATAGAGEAAVATERAVEGAEVAAELAVAAERGTGAAARAAGLSEDVATALQERFGSPSAGALDFQGRDLYPGRDNWFDTILDKGDTFSVGSPGEGQFAAAPESVAEVGTDARRYYEGLQVGPREDPVDGVARYRPSLLTYEVQQPLPVAESIAAANPQFGAGGHWVNILGSQG